MRRTAKSILTLSLTLVVFSIAELSAQGDTTVFTFENQAAAEGLTTLTLVQPDLSVTITRPSTVFGIADLTEFPFQGLPTSFGSRSLAPIGNTEQSLAFIANFSSSVSSVSIDMGNASQELDTLRLEAFAGANATGTLLATSTAILAASQTPFAFNFATLSLTASEINSIRFIGGNTTFGNSVFYDNITAVPIPEPTTLVLLATGLAGAAAAVRRRRQTRQQFQASNN